MANKQNPILAAFEAKLRREFAEEKAQLEADFKIRLTTNSEINMIAMLIAGNDLRFIGEKRAGPLLEDQIEVKMKLAEELLEDSKDDKSLAHTKRDLSVRLKQILGSSWNKYKYLFPIVRDYWEE
jgi:hypothetical protein